MNLAEEIGRATSTDKGNSSTVGRRDVRGGRLDFGWFVEQRLSSGCCLTCRSIYLDIYPHLNESAFSTCDHRETRTLAQGGAPLICATWQTFSGMRRDLSLLTERFDYGEAAACHDRECGNTRYSLLFIRCGGPVTWLITAWPANRKGARTLCRPLTISRPSHAWPMARCLLRQNDGSFRPVPSETDQPRVRSMTDEEIERQAANDPDHPGLDEAFWAAIEHQKRPPPRAKRGDLHQASTTTCCVIFGVTEKAIRPASTPFCGATSKL